MTIRLAPMGHFATGDLNLKLVAMSEFLWTIAAIWAISVVLAGILFTLDERTHRRASTSGMATQAAAESESPARLDHVLA